MPGCTSHPQAKHQPLLEINDANMCVCVFVCGGSWWSSSAAALPEPLVRDSSCARPRTRGPDLSFELECSPLRGAEPRPRLVRMSSFASAQRLGSARRHSRTARAAQLRRDSPRECPHRPRIHTENVDFSIAQRKSFGLALAQDRPACTWSTACVHKRIGV